MRYRTPAIAVAMALVIALAWGATSPNTFANPLRELELSRSGPRLESCQTCHAVDPAFSHPVGVSPLHPTPASLPLEQGAVTCTTCHLDDIESHVAARLDHKGMLRPELANGNACAACHRASSGTRANLHALSLNRAHLTTNPRRPFSGRAAGPPAPGAPKLDTQSQSCIACHDGVVSSDVQYSTTVRNPLTMGLGAHPVGVRPSAGMTVADPRLQLADGRVSCTTCHSPYSQEKKLLVMSNRGSQLCLSCHSRI